MKSQKTNKKLSEETKRKISMALKGKMPKNINLLLSDEIRKKQIKAVKNNCGEKSTSWKGGKFLDKDGYVLVYKPKHKRSHHNGYVYEHIFLAGKYIGRNIKKSENVHHIDGNKQNNSIENLEIMTRAQHTIHHRTGYKHSEETKNKIALHLKGNKNRLKIKHAPTSRTI